MLDVMFEDDHILVVNKPAGLATQAPRQFDSLEARVRAYFTSSNPQDASYLGIPHRLDRAVSGVIVFAKRKKAAQRLSRQFERRKTRKVYVARVAGNVDQQMGTWRDTMRKVPGEARAELVSADHQDAKTAVMHFELQSVNEDFSQICIQLETGRMHQIRVQCASRGFPVLGDVLYGCCQSFGPVCEHDRDRQIALHACELAFHHPRTKDDVAFKAPLPSTWLGHTIRRDQGGGHGSQGN